MSIEDLIQKCKTIKIDPTFIQYIRFPFYKNLESNARIDFKFHITALTGENGTNKSSVLKALYGAPEGSSLGNLWFSSSVDEIKDEGRSRFIYGYYIEKYEIVEVRKSRILRNKDPDYWEPTRPNASDGMKPMPVFDKNSKYDIFRTQTRWNQLKKNIIYVDFRSEVSAFERVMSRSAFTKLANAEQDKKKEFIRNRSKPLKNSLDRTYSKWHGKERVFTNQELGDDAVQIISSLLGRKYKSIKLIEHAFYDQRGFTVKIVSEGLEYTEAFAGSGEFTVIMLVYRILNAPPNSLILLDEPEISLHPSAQHKLMSFLYEQCKISNHQVVISTHSPNIIKDLPKEAIKVLQKINDIVVVLQDISHQDAFFYIGQKNEKKTIFVEDKLAKKIVEKSIRNDHALFDQIIVTVLPGGAETILKYHICSFLHLNTNNFLFILDGDKNYTNNSLKTSAQIAPEDLNDTLDSQFKIKNLISEGNNGKSDKYSKQALLIKYFDFTAKYLKFLPFDSPEGFLLENITQVNKSEQFESSDKGQLALLARNAFQREVNAEDIMRYAEIRLNELDEKKSEFEYIRTIISDFLDLG